MPDWSAALRARLASLRLSPVRETEIIEELGQHLDDYWRELVSGGASPEEATRTTLAELRSGDVLAKHLAPLRQAQSSPPIVPGGPAIGPLSDMSLDLRYGLRQFWKQPAFAAAAVLTLALGIGATTAVFSVVYGVLLKPLPFPEPERLVGVYHRAPAMNLPVVNHGPGTYLTYRDQQRAFEGIGAWESDEVSITGRGEPEQVEALVVTASTLPVLRSQPLLGRLFTAEDDAPGAPLRVILSYGYWQRRFGGTPAVAGTTLRVDGRPAEVIGVLPSSFKFLRTNAAVLLPMQLDEANVFRGIMFDFQAVARLKRETSLPQANADVARMIPLLPQAFATLQLEPNVQPLADEVIGDVGRILWLLLAAVGIVLIIACGNVANLFLVRAEGRQAELAMRAALGASRLRLVRTMLSESVLLALAGGALGLLFAQAAIALLRRMAPADLPRLDEISIDATVLFFTQAISLACGLLFGLVPAMRVARADTAALKDAGRGLSEAPAGRRTRNMLVVAEISLALMLMIVSGLMIRTFMAMRQVEPGFSQPQDVQTFRVALPESVVADAEQAARTYQLIAERLAQLPGVTAVGLSSSITMDGEDNANPLDVEEFPVVSGTPPPLRRFKSMAPGYFETMGNRLIAGRSITWDDIYQQQRVVVVSETLAREYWQEPSRALGKRVRIGTFREWGEIIGVVGHERDDGLNKPATAIVYWPLLNDSYQRRTMAYAVRSARAGTAAFVRELQQAVWAANPNLPLAAVQTLAAIRARSMAQTSFAMVMLGIAAAVALLLGVVGIFGVITYIAAQRTREIGIRMALGAQVADVRTLFLRQGLWLTAIGIALGIGGALLLTRVMSALLYGVGPMDPTTYAGVSAALAAVALFATYLPARRASRVDPMVALRSDV